MAKALQVNRNSSKIDFVYNYSLLTTFDEQYMKIVINAQKDQLEHFTYSHSNIAFYEVTPTKYPLILYK